MVLNPMPSHRHRNHGITTVWTAAVQNSWSPASAGPRVPTAFT